MEVNLEFKGRSPRKSIICVKEVNKFHNLGVGSGIKQPYWVPQFAGIQGWGSKSSEFGESGCHVFLEFGIGGDSIPLLPSP